ncbi:MAG: cytidylate kinase-like family protein [Lachnospiraceae bacterium]|nr:cytidylate kinase-like family protein [Lachnospiraceae bacterium]
MDKQVIITIGREYGCGGLIIAKDIAEHYKIPLYDKNILEAVAAEKGISAEVFEAYSEKPRNKFLSRNVRGQISSIEHHVAEMQFEYLRERAESGESFVVLGRCAEEVLKDYPGLIKLFILADADFKLNHVMTKFNLSEPAAEAQIKKFNKQRKLYHNSYCDFKWGDSRSYDLTINSSRLGLNGTLKTLIDYIDTRIETMDF